MRVVVDGANVVGARPDGWWRDRPAAAQRLADVMRTKIAADPELRVVLVLEGEARGGPPEATGPLTVVHASGSGDDEIVRQSVGADLVVTADRELRGRVLPVACTGPSWVWGAVSR